MYTAYHKKISKRFLSAFLMGHLLLTSDLYGMDDLTVDSPNTRVMPNNGPFSLGLPSISTRAFNVYVQFPISHLTIEELSQQLSQLPINERRLEDRYLKAVIEKGEVLGRRDRPSSLQMAWNELESRLLSPRRGENEKAAYKLALAKMIMGSHFHPDRFNQPIDCYNFVLSHLYHVAYHEDQSVERRYKTHARIWYAMMLTKKNMVFDGKNREQTLQTAWELYEEAYKHSATDSTLFFQLELIVRYGVKPNNCTEEEAFKIARELYRKIGERSEKSNKSSQTRSRLKRMMQRSQALHSHKPSLPWHMARAAFMKDIGDELEVVMDELRSLKQEPRSALNDSFSQAIIIDEGGEDIYYEEGEDEEAPEKSVTVLGFNPTLPAELNSVRNLIAPHNPQMVRAFNPQTGEYIFFNEYDVSGYQNDCAFNCMGLTRQEALDSLLNNSHRPIVRQLVAPQIVLHIMNKDIPESFNTLNVNIQVGDRQRSFQGRNLLMRYALDQAALGRAVSESRGEAQERYNQSLEWINQFAYNESVYKAFVRYALAEGKMMEYQRDDQGSQLTSILNALALIHQFNLEIWTRSDMDGLVEAIFSFNQGNFTLQKVVNYSPVGANRTVRMRHMRQNVDGMNHFRFLIPNAGISNSVGAITGPLSTERGHAYDVDQDEHDVLDDFVENFNQTSKNSLSDQDWSMYGASSSSIEEDSEIQSVAHGEEEQENMVMQESSVSSTESESDEVDEDDGESHNPKKRKRDEMDVDESMERHKDPWELTKQRVFQYYQEGKNKETIAGLLKIDSGQVSKILEEDFGIKRKKYSRQLSTSQKKIILNHFGGSILSHRTYSSKSMAEAAKQAGCSSDQVRRFIQRQVNGIPSPLEKNHKIFVRKLAFDATGKRLALVSATEIARKMTNKYGRRFEDYQVSNYIRSLLKTDKYRL